MPLHLCLIVVAFPLLLLTASWGALVNYQHSLPVKQASLVVAELPVIASTSFVVFPADCNANPPMLFGGKILSEMDRCAGIAVRRILRKSPSKIDYAVTVNATVDFKKAGKVKDLVIVSADSFSTGKKSITVKLTASRELDNGSTEVLASGTYTFVAYDPTAEKAVEHGIVTEPTKPTETGK